MKIQEYQAKEFFRRYGIVIQEGGLANTPEEVRSLTSILAGRVVIKAQVQVGGRGKAGGIKLADTPDEAFVAAKTLLGADIKGVKVKKVLVLKAVDIQKEFYVGITVDRAVKKVVFMVSSAGGVDIEEISARTPQKIKKVYIEPSLGFCDFYSRQLAFELFPVCRPVCVRTRTGRPVWRADGTDKSEIKSVSQISSLFKKLYNLFEENDCSLVEINPLVLTANGEILALDAKIIFDDNALPRHPDFEDLRDLDEEDSDELAAQRAGLSFVKLDGNIGCIVNGAGLAMATMDMIKLYGAEPANFLDVGGSSNPKKIIKAFELILKNKKIKSVLINIFGGITRCDDIAAGIIQSKEMMQIEIPIVIRLIGTNAEKAKEKLSNLGLVVYSDMHKAVRRVIEVTGEYTN